MFKVQFYEGALISGTGNPEVADSNPITQVLDSSSEIPDAGAPVALDVFLPTGKKCEVVGGIGGTRVEFEGEGNRFWEVTNTDPSLPTTTWNKSLNISILPNLKTRLWVRGNTDSGENSQNDTRPKLKFFGKIEAS